MRAVTLFLFTIFFAVGWMVAVAGENAGGHSMPGMEGAAAEWSEADDGAFLHGMIEHHKGAVEMALAVVKTAKDESVTTWAKNVIETQEKEILRMRELAGKLGLSDDSGAAEMMREHMRMMLEHPVSPDADIDFVAQMVPHHAGAVDMALPALVESTHPEIRKLACDIIAAQAREIFEFNEWLDKKGYKRR